MSDNVDFKQLWKKQEAPSSTIDELLEKMHSFRRKKIRSLIFANIKLLLTSGFILFIWYYFEPEMLSTKIGIVSVVVSMFLYLFVYNKAFFIKKSDFGVDANRYLQLLLRMKKRQHFLQTTILNLYFFLLTTGICLYLYEYASRMTRSGAAITYGITLLWIALNWFYFRPKAIKKQRNKLDAVIQKVEGLNQQLDD